MSVVLCIGKIYFHFFLFIHLSNLEMFQAPLAGGM